MRMRLLAVALCLAPAWSAAQTADAPAIERGRTLFEQHCASCHGKTGRGDGPAAATLAIKPPDLTLMRHRNGAFLAAAVESAITGSNSAVVHRAPGMITWSAIFRAGARGNQAAGEARTRDLVAFIESIQEK